MMENIVIYFLGPLGTFLILIAYFLLQYGAWQSNGKNYLLSNILGSSLLISTNYYEWNLSYFSINVCWLLISLHSFYKISKYKNE